MLGPSPTFLEEKFFFRPESFNFLGHSVMNGVFTLNVLAALTH